MRVGLLSFAVVLFLNSQAFGQQASSCAEVSDSLERLTCYDKENAGLLAKEMKFSEEDVSVLTSMTKFFRITDPAIGANELRETVVDGCFLYHLHSIYDASPRYQNDITYNIDWIDLSAVQRVSLRYETVTFEMKRDTSGYEIRFSTDASIPLLAIGQNFQAYSANAEFSARPVRINEITFFLASSADKIEAEEILNRMVGFCTNAQSGDESD